MVAARMDSNIATKINASVNLTPPGSHVIVLSLISILGISLVATFAFVHLGTNYWIPLIVSAIVLIVIVVFWLRSHRDIDHASIAPTTLSTIDANKSTTISIHPRANPSMEDLASLERIISMMRNISPLPDPDGLVDGKGRPVPDSQHDARVRVASTNEQTQRKLESIVGSLEEPISESRLEQLTLSDTPDLSDTKETNLADEKI